MIQTEQVIGTAETTLQKMEEIMGAISWHNIIMTYFKGKSASWFYNKLHERDINGNGKPYQFSPEELQIIKGALVDLSDRLRRTADKL